MKSGQFLLRKVTLLWIPLAAALATGCGRSMLYRDKVDETFLPQFNGTNFKVIAVIAGNDSRPDLNMSAGVRNILTDSGFTALPAPGRWETESEAAMELCLRPGFNAVVVVVYDRLTVRACPGREIAYEIRGGADLGLRGMAQRLMVYLRTGRPPLQEA